MITISENIAPRVSYKNILQNSITLEVFTKTLEDLNIPETNKKKLISDFLILRNKFEDPSYTGDINQFSANLYKTLDNIPNSIDLFGILATEAFVKQSTENIKSLIGIELEANNQSISLSEFISIAKIKKERSPNILYALRGLYSFDEDRQIRWDTTELVAALKKHLVTNTSQDSTQKFSRLIEKKQHDELIIKESTQYFSVIKSNTELLYPRNKKTLDQWFTYSQIIDKVEQSLKYFAHSNDDNKQKLDKLIYEFIENLVEYGLTEYGADYRFLGRDVFSVEIMEKTSLDNLKTLLKYNTTYKKFCIKQMNNKIKELQSSIKRGQGRLSNFERPSREKRCARAPYRGAPIKSDQEYSLELRNIGLGIEIDKKNLDLMKTYILELQD